MRIDPALIDADAAKVVRRLQHSGYTAYLVGGCVRDLLLGRTPKDFDVATSAEPNAVKRLFRNCRIIGRRFRLAHVFFGPKIIETATFRQSPRVEGAEGAEGENGALEEEQELLIRRDNVFGTADEDARRRDFTINGLFYNLATEQVIDYVGGAVDLSAGLVRTIGDPEIRLREDPIRILRAIKFAARLGFTIEPATYAAMLAARGEIPKCAAPRILEEIYRLLRSGAAAASMRLLLETGVLDVLVPELARLLEDAGVPPAPALEPAPRRELPAPPLPVMPHLLAGPEAALAAADLCGLGRDALDDGERAAPLGPALARPPVERCFATLELLDALVREGPAPPSNAVILGALLWPFLDDVLAEEGLKGHEVGVRLEDAIQPILIRLHASRRDSERVRQILLSQRRLAQPPRRKHTTLARREHFADAVALFHITCQVRGLPLDEVDQWRRMMPAPGAAAEELFTGGGEAGPEPGRRRRRRGGRRRRRPERAGVAPAES